MRDRDIDRLTLENNAILRARAEKAEQRAEKAERMAADLDYQVGELIERLKAVDVTPLQKHHRLRHVKIHEAGLISTEEARKIKGVQKYQTILQALQRGALNGKMVDGYWGVIPDAKWDAYAPDPQKVAAGKMGGAGRHRARTPAREAEA